MMTTMNAEVYDALVSAGADEEKARKAAESVSQFDEKFLRIEAKLNQLTWMVGLILAVIVLPHLKTFFT